MAANIDNVGKTVYYIILNAGKEKLNSMIGDIGPYATEDAAQNAADKVVESREGEKLLSLLGVDTIRVRSRIVT